MATNRAVWRSHPSILGQMSGWPGVSVAASGCRDLPSIQMITATAAHSHLWVLLNPIASGSRKFDSKKGSRCSRGTVLTSGLLEVVTRTSKAAVSLIGLGGLGWEADEEIGAIGTQPLCVPGWSTPVWTIGCSPLSWVMSDDTRRVQVQCLWPKTAPIQGSSPWKHDVFCDLQFTVKPALLIPVGLLWNSKKPLILEDKYKYSESLNYEILQMKNMQAAKADRDTSDVVLVAQEVTE